MANPVLGAEAPLFTPAPELKIGGCRARCAGSYTTSNNGGSSDWGIGSSCAAAQTDLDTRVFNRADANCVNLGYEGACSVTTVVTTGCGWNGNVWAYQVDGYANYSCVVVICTDPIDPYQ